MEYLNDRIVLLSQVAHTRGLIERAERFGRAPLYLLARLEQEEAALNEYDEQIKVKTD